MFSRILFSTIAAATLLTAAPTLAADGGASNQPCSCCSDGSNHDVDHALREAQKQKGSAERKAEPRTNQENPDVRNQSWGG
jgi:hypothetical protein